MGMREERQKQASGLEAHAKRMYEETANPYWVVTAIAAARWGEFTPPKWALDILLKAVDTAWLQHEAFDTDVSIDASLGLHKLRGKKSNERSANRASIESSAFDLVKTIHTCFDVSIPKACELAYFAVDYDFSRHAEETLWRPTKGEHPLSPGITSEEWNATNDRWKENSKRIISSPNHTTKVQAKLEICAWWTITHGDRLGYSLDQLIDRYYRVGGKRRVPHGKITEHEWLLFQGHFLLAIPEKCSHAITFNDRKHCVSALSGLQRRPDFVKLEARLATVRKSSI